EGGGGWGRGSGRGDRRRTDGGRGGSDVAVRAARGQFPRARRVGLGRGSRAVGGDPATHGAAVLRLSGHPAKRRRSRGQRPGRWRRTKSRLVATLRTLASTTEEVCA